MKLNIIAIRVMVTILGLFSFSLAHAQYGYKYNGEFIRLMPDENPDNIELNSKLQSLTNKTLGVRGKEFEYSSKVYLTPEEKRIQVLPAILLKTEREIESIIEPHKDVLSLENKRVDGVYRLSCNVSTSDEVLDFVAKVGDMEGVEWCEPDMYSEINTSNYYYYTQYNLFNNGIVDGGSIGINAEPAWFYTNGKPNIKVAIIDAGVDNNHIDMQNTVLDGYTCGYPLEKGAPINANYNNAKYHGIACAGIVAANNNIAGIRGIASNAKILPVNIFPRLAMTYGDSGSTTTDSIAGAIIWAADRADILSCSWEMPLCNNVQSAIEYALENGRGGKGCIVVASAGNNVNTVCFPANIDGVISVGAVSQYGTIANYSPSGSDLDLVAPGNNIFTLDRMGELGFDPTDDYLSFSGTSAACPQVSGVAALILSVDSTLTESEVSEILFSTAYDLGDQGRDDTFGYGIVDVGKSIWSIVPFPLIIGSNTVCEENAYQLLCAPSAFDVSWELEPFTHPRWLTIEEQTDSGCIVQNTLYGPFNTNLIANISYDGMVVKSVSKSLRGYGDFSLSGTQLGNSNYSTRTFSTSDPYAIIPVNPLCNITLTSDNFDGVNLSLSGAPPLIQNKQGNTLLLKLPTGLNDYAFHIAHSDPLANCNDFDIILMVTTSLLPEALPGADITRIGNNLLIALKSYVVEPLPSPGGGTGGMIGNWDLNIYRLDTGQRVYTENVGGTETYVNVGGWASGMYAVNIVYGNKLYTQKYLLQ